MMNFNIKDISQQKGKIAIVTGANEGVGYQTTLGLISKSVKVVMACRNLQKAELAKSNLLFKVPAAELEIIHLDLMDLASVRNFADIFKSKYQQLDILVNNAGIMVPPFSKTVDGFERQMGVNYFAHFLLTNLLFPLLQKSPAGRVISLSSIAHKGGKIYFSNLNSEQKYNRVEAYCQSKLACLIFAFELQKRLDLSVSNVKSIAVHPGVSNTNIAQFLPKFALYAFSLCSSLFFHSPEHAVLPSLFAALSEDAKGGKFYGPTGFMEMKGNVGEAASSKASHKAELAQELWKVSEELTKEKFVL